MCRNVTSLIYGLPVRTYTLARAADAWPHLEAPLRFFYLVALRLRKGELSARRDDGQPAVVERVPVEVWMLIREEVVDLELAKAEEGLVKEFCCWCPYWDDDAGEYVPKPEKRWADEIKKTWPCETCGDQSLWDFRRIWGGDRLPLVEKLLQPFSLDLVSAPSLRSFPSWAKSAPDPEWDDPSSACFLTSPMFRSSGCGASETSSVCEHESVGSGVNEQLVFDIAFHIPSKQHCPFFALARLFRLETLASLDDTWTSPADGGVTPSAAELEVQTRFRTLAPGDVAPSWILTSTCETWW
ncbi:hypothetical protein JCM6882_007246 [Rhodosporidiobolus microsporus]